MGSSSVVLVPSPEQLIGPFPPGSDPTSYDQLRRRILWLMPAGLYLLGSRSGDERNMMTASLVVQLSVRPKLVGVSIETSAKSLGLVRGGGGFSLGLLSRADRAVVRKFVKPASLDLEAMELNGLGFFDSLLTGSPVLSLVHSYLDCTLEREVALGSHVLVIGEVVDAGVLHQAVGEEVEVLTMSDTRMSYGG